MKYLEESFLSHLSWMDKEAYVDRWLAFCQRETLGIWLGIL
jgi:hypothetical protein